jgi:hypothetical protein
MRLLEQLETFDGWALSTSRRSLRYILSLIPGGDGLSPTPGDDELIVAPWVKTHFRPKARGPANIHEYVLVKPARRLINGPPDALVAAAARGGDSNLIGRKPIRFCFWVFNLLGASPGDDLDDLFPGSGVVGRCWSEFRRTSMEEENG